jgi:hypothetical protein
MAGVNVEGGKGKRKSVDSEINMIPMIDLMMVTVSFLLITAVWSQMGRVEANAQVPGTPEPCSGDCTPKVERRLHVEARPEQPFRLTWREGAKIVETYDVPREAPKAGRSEFAQLGAKAGELWNASGAHRDPTDPKRDTAVLHVDDGERYEDVIAMMDALSSVRRSRTQPALAVTFATR